jgi:type VI secretion system secreted protein VgrG
MYDTETQTLPISQENRLLRLDLNLPKDTLLISSFSATEQISGLYEANVELVAEKQNASKITSDKLIGGPACLTVSVLNDFQNGPQRYFHGVVSRFHTGHIDDYFAHYRAEIVPWLWLLTLDIKSRIFQSMTVPEIVEKIFDEYKGDFPNVVDYANRLNAEYPKLDYCVQYQESSFQFVNRLLEEEGIFYFFEHAKDKHSLVLADSPQAIKVCPEQPKADWVMEAGWKKSESPILSWEMKHELRPGKYTMRDYHMQMPSKNLEVHEPTIHSSQPGKPLEIYDYPGEYASRFNQAARDREVQPEAQRLVRLRMEAQDARFQENHATSLCRAFMPGQKFELAGGSSKKQSYTLTSVRHTAVQFPWYKPDPQYSTEEPYRNTFSCIPEEVTFRPPRKTPKPRVYGPQTAVVVGKAGEEIWTDEFGRVKVQFHWDRDGKKDENSSCWVRVSHPWAGKNWGAISIPRIGQEVVVDFLEGDPDQPIITGRVYNSEQMPPFTLPGGAVVMGIKSDSTKGGGGYNEFSMDDTKGTEKINTHAQFDMITTVEHDNTQTIHNNRKIDVDGTHTETVKGDTSIEVKEGKYTHKVTANTADYTVQGALTETYNTTQKTTVAKQIDITSSNSHIHLVADADEITLKSGLSQLVMKNDGTIVLSGKTITIVGTQDVTSRVSTQSVTCNPQMVHSQGAKINSTAVGLHEISGALIKIN